MLIFYIQVLVVYGQVIGRFKDDFFFFFVGLLDFIIKDFELSEDQVKKGSDGEMKKEKLFVFL